MKFLVPAMLLVASQLLTTQVVADVTADSRKSDVLSASSKSDRWRFTADFELNTPLIGALAGGDRLLNTRAAGLRLGAGKGRFNIFGFAERGHFEAPSYDEDVSNDLFSAGMGGTVSYFHHRMRSMLLLGTTVLLTESFQNERGTIGFYSEIRPAGFEIPFGDFNLQIYPITLSWLIPVLQNIPLFYVHYRTAISIGGAF
ncbi:MAG: hypothetical protein JXX14_00100 [Deltaproteobacteria bacterium]|nr:hypothetical protein [Deltaproteobacteria bacterium]